MVGPFSVKAIDLIAKYSKGLILAKVTTSLRKVSKGNQPYFECWNMILEVHAFFFFHIWNMFILSVTDEIIVWAGFIYGP